MFSLTLAHTCKHTHAHARTSVHVHAYAHICTHMHAYARTYIPHMHAHALKLAHTRTLTAIKFILHVLRCPTLGIPIDQYFFFLLAPPLELNMESRLVG